MSTSTVTLTAEEMQVLRSLRQNPNSNSMSLWRHVWLHEVKPVATETGVKKCLQALTERYLVTLSDKSTIIRPRYKLTPAGEKALEAAKS